MTDRMSTAEFRLLKEKYLKKKNKYNAKSFNAYSIYFPSLTEYRFHEYCLNLVRAGELTHFLTHVPIHLNSGKKLVLDKILFYKNSRVRYIDVKGVLTELFILKKKEIEKIYPFIIEIAREKNGRWVITDE